MHSYIVFDFNQNGLKGFSIEDVCDIPRSPEMQNVISSNHAGCGVAQAAAAQPVFVFRFSR
jgi:hypothetical protein